MRGGTLAKDSGRPTHGAKKPSWLVGAAGACCCSKTSQPAWALSIKGKAQWACSSLA
jgi:hypothetical protein